MDIKTLARIGIVSSVNASNCTARVTFPDKDNLVSAELPIITRGSQNDKDYWLPDINEQVLCLFLPNASGNGVNNGFILGTFYSNADTPAESATGINSMHFADGSIVKHDRSTGNITIKATGNIDIIAGGTVTVNGATVNIN